jgi:hypothetical protein
MLKHGNFTTVGHHLLFLLELLIVLILADLHLNSKYLLL